MHDQLNELLANAHWPRHVMRASDYSPRVILVAYRRALAGAREDRRRSRKPVTISLRGVDIQLSA